MIQKYAKKINKIAKMKKEHIQKLKINYKLIKYYKLLTQKMQGLQFFETVRKTCKYTGKIYEKKVLHFENTLKKNNLMYNLDHKVSMNDESFIVTDTSDSGNCIRIWDPLTGETSVFVTTIEDGHILGPTIFNKQKSIVVSLVHNTSAQFLQIWDSNTTQCLQIILALENTSFGMTPDGTRIVTINDYIEILDIKTAKSLNRIRSPSFAPYSDIVFDLSGDSQKLITGGKDKLLRVWNIETLECQHIFQGHEGTIINIGTSYDSSRLASVDKRNQMMIWDTLTGERLRVISAYNVMSIKFNFDATHVLFGETLNHRSSEVYLLEIAKREINHIYPFGQSLPITAVDFCYGGNFWNRRIKYNYCSFLRNTHTTVIAASTKNTDLPFLPTEIWEYIFEFSPIQDSVITASVNATATIIHL
jgi:WD40 repeat protein